MSITQAVGYNFDKKTSFKVCATRNLACVVNDPVAV